MVIESLNQTSPAEVVGDIVGGNAVEATHPRLKSTVAGIDVFHVINPGNAAYPGGKIDGAMR